MMTPMISPKAAAPRSAQRAQAGFSLVELMIAITLGMLIVAAVLALYLNISSANSELAKANGQIENGRFAMQLLENDVVHAGFWGTYVPQFDDLTQTAAPTDAPSAVPDSCLDFTSWDAAYKTNLIGIPVQSYDGAAAGCSAVTSQKANTDALVVRHAEICLPGVGNCEADTAGKIYFQASLCDLENATPYVLSTSAFTLHNRDCVGTGSPATLPITAGTIADKRRYVSNIYYIRSYAVTPGDGIPTLMRSSFDGTAPTAAQPLIEGIDGFRVELGLDTISDNGADITAGSPPLYQQAIAWADTTNLISPTNRGDGIPDSFVHCPAAGCTLAQLTNVVAVKIYVLARARESTPGYTTNKTYALGSTTLGPFTDGFKRHVFSTTVRLTNVSGRRETP